MYLHLCVWVGEGGGGHFVGLGDNYSRDHLFSGMRYSNKRLRERERGSEMEEKREQDRGLEDN